MLFSPIPGALKRLLFKIWQEKGTGGSKATTKLRDVVNRQ
jgi:hypothetical protein